MIEDVKILGICDQKLRSGVKTTKRWWKGRMTKRVGRGGIEQVMQQKGWKGNSEGKMDRERWLCVILWTPFIYTWNKRPGLGCKRVSWWGLKWNWHFQFVLWHVCLGLFTHSSASPSLAILLSNPPFSLSLSLSLFLPYTSLQTSSPINLSLTFSHLPQSPPKGPQSNKEIWTRFLIRYTKHFQKNTCAHCTINICPAHGTPSREGCRQIHQRLITWSVQEVKYDE